jgi:capsular polysaccharide export protein
MLGKQTHSNRPPNHVLILQGDWEGGLTKVAKDLQANGTKVSKVLFEPCDLRYKLCGIISEKFDAPLSGFSDWLSQKIDELDIDCLLIYNEYRPYNRRGFDLAKEKNIQCIVLELGLLRPDFISIYSRERDLFDYLQNRWHELEISGDELEDIEEPKKFRSSSTTYKIRQFAIAYLCNRFITFFFQQFKHYEDQRKMDFIHHFSAGVKSQLRFHRRAKQKRFDKILESKWSKGYYLIPLQVHCDSQIKERSKFQGSSPIEDFIVHVVDSFEKHAPENTKLIFKVHPIDRGYADYAKFIENLGKRFNKERLYYLDRISNPIALKNARGCVMINSSMGISALLHGTPVKTLGKASFDLPELTFQGSLDDFWTQASSPDPMRVKNFINLLKLTSQGQGTFYQKIFDVKGESKIKWPKEFSYLFPEQ